MAVSTFQAINNHITKCHHFENSFGALGLSSSQQIIILSIYLHIVYISRKYLFYIAHLLVGTYECVYASKQNVAALMVYKEHTSACLSHHFCTGGQRSAKRCFMLSMKSAVTSSHVRMCIVQFTTTRYSCPLAYGQQNCDICHTASRVPHASNSVFTWAH